MNQLVIEEEKRSIEAAILALKKTITTPLTTRLSLSEQSSKMRVSVIISVFLVSLVLLAIVVIEEQKDKTRGNLKNREILIQSLLMVFLAETQKAWKLKIKEGLILKKLIDLRKKNPKIAQIWRLFEKSYKKPEPKPFSVTASISA